MHVDRAVNMDNQTRFPFRATRREGRDADFFHFSILSRKASLSQDGRPPIKRNINHPEGLVRKMRKRRRVRLERSRGKSVSPRANKMQN